MRLYVFLFSIFISIGVQAQKGLAIGAAFEEYAVKKNATEVVMGASRLKKYNLSLFHSLEIKGPSATDRQRIEKLIETDASAAEATPYEETTSHKLYELPQRKGMHYYIFYRCTSQSLILIYIEGKASLKQIEAQFLKR